MGSVNVNFPCISICPFVHRICPAVHLSVCPCGSPSKGVISGYFCDNLVKVCAFFIISSMILVFSLTFRRVLSPISFFSVVVAVVVCASVGMGA